MRIAVFCSSSPTIDGKYIDLAKDLGIAIGSRNWDLVSGGGHISMMGAVAQGVRSAGGRTIGVIPQSLVDIEFADTESDELHVVSSMRERKALMEEKSDAFIALPGGIGTLEELFEIWVGRFLSFHDKPVIILDPYDLFAPLRVLVDHLEVEGFIKPGQRELLHWARTIDEALAECHGKRGYGKENG
ncbi:MAG TPA: TIGR00730 family Rossman fold protein [Candidatus Nanopelagicaceae bacterium]